MFFRGLSLFCNQDVEFCLSWYFSDVVLDFLWNCSSHAGFLVQLVIADNAGILLAEPLNSPQSENVSTLKQFYLLQFNSQVYQSLMKIFSFLTYIRVLLYKRPANTVRGLLPVWVSSIAGLTNRELHFRIEITQGMIPSGFPIFWMVIPGCSWNGSRASPYSKFIEFWQSTQNTWLHPTNFLRQFLVTLPFFPLTLRWCILQLFSHPRN